MPSESKNSAQQGSTAVQDPDRPASSTSSDTRLSPVASQDRLPGLAYEPLIDRIERKIATGQRWFSCEFFPPRTVSGAVNLISKFDQFAKGNPLFCDITWHPAGDPAADKPSSSLLIASTMLNYCGLETMLHMTCVRHNRDEVTDTLRRAQSRGIRNILALRGDPVAGSWDTTERCFNYAVDMVRHIRQEFGDHFVICVAGYPTGHPEAPSYADDLRHLKEKVDAGADFIITQLFFDTKVFLKFETDCRQIGIQCPIIPGILPIQTYQSVEKIASVSKLKLPENIQRVLDSIRDNEDAVRNYGIDLATEMCKELFDSGRVHGIHFYTLNRAKATVDILKRVGLWLEDLPRPLPWKPTANHERVCETTRPIFWSLRPNAYVYRTTHWDEYPSGRWGSASSAAFGELEDYYLFYLKPKEDQAQLRKMWGEELTCEADVWEVFVNYLSNTVNKAGVKVTCLPWSDEDLRPETSEIQHELLALNKRGFLTINSQPNVNGAESSHTVYGWGGPNGFVYQKAYLEFFVDKKYLTSLLNQLEGWSDRVNYHIVNSQGDEWTNCEGREANAVTWGVFPGRELLQPTVVDPAAFGFWKDEAFGLWMNQWAVLYEEGSPSFKTVAYIHDHYLLVNLVDNCYPRQSCLWELLAGVSADEGEAAGKEQMTSTTVRFSVEMLA